MRITDVGKEEQPAQSESGLVTTLPPLDLAFPQAAGLAAHLRAQGIEQDLAGDIAFLLEQAAKAARAQSAAAGHTAHKPPSEKQRGLQGLFFGSSPR